MKHLATTTFAACLLFSGLSFAAEDKLPPQTLFTNVNIFNGIDDKLYENHSVLVEGNLIKAISAGEIKVNAGATVIDGSGRTLMPGLHDMHTHVSIFRPVAGDLRTDMSPFLVGAVTAARVEGMLMNGFTTIRDTGGPAKFIQRAVDAGVVPGPRMYPSEGFITQTAGHGDFRNRNDPHPNRHGGPYNYIDEYYSCIADGEAEIRRCIREQLGLGATQIKIFTGGGVASEKDPLHSVQYTPTEIRVAVETAAQWKTYVMAHAFTDESIRIAVENGVQVIEHGPLMTEESAKLMAEKGTFLVPSVAAILGLDLEGFKKISSAATYAKGIMLVDGVPKEMEYAVKHKVKMAFGTDLLSSWENSVVYDKDANLEFKWLAKFMPNVEVLKMATSNAGELARLSGPNNPYQEGPTGVIAKGAYADILIVEGNPLEDIMVMTNPGENFSVIMKDGRIYKNTL